MEFEVQNSKLDSNQNVPAREREELSVPSRIADRKTHNSDWPTKQLNTGTLTAAITTTTSEPAADPTATNESATSESASNQTATNKATTKKAPCRTQAIEAILSSKSKSKLKQPQKLETYSTESRRPIVCLLFVLPLVIFYEIGSIFLGRESLRSGIDQWIHQILSQLGIGQLVVLPILTIGLMVYWHHRINDHWKINPRCILGMLGEAIGLGLILFWAASATDLLGHESANIGARFGSEIASGSALLSTIVAHVGSGIYEEVIFRVLLLVPIIHWIGSLLGAPKNGEIFGKTMPHIVPQESAKARTDSKWKIATVIGIVLVSLLFAAVHYNFFNPAGNQFELSSFVFRFAASIVFCVLFLFRGFGIAVGAHVAYDVLMQL